MVEQACAIKDMPTRSEAVTPRSQDAGGKHLDVHESLSPQWDRRQAPFPPLLSIYAPTTEQGHDVTDDWGQSPVDLTLENIDGMHLLLDSEGDSLNPVMIKRVQSANLILRKSLSRQTMARRVLSGRAPRYFTKSGQRISDFANKPIDTALSAQPSHSGAKKVSTLISVLQFSSYAFKFRYTNAEQQASSFLSRVQTHACRVRSVTAVQ